MTKFFPQVVVMALVAFFPFSPRGLSDRAYRLALVGSAISCAHGLYQQIRVCALWSQILISERPNSDLKPTEFNALKIIYSCDLTCQATNFLQYLGQYV